MDPVTMAIFASSAVSAYGSVRAGKAAKQEAQFNAAQMERDMELGRIEATQNATAMAQDYAQSVSANDAFFAFAGRDVTDRSVRAFMERQEEIYSTDIARLASDTNMRAQSVAAMAGAERQRGRNALTAGYLGAAESIAEGGYRAAKIGTGDPSTPTVKQSKPSISYSGKYRRAY